MCEEWGEILALFSLVVRDTHFVAENSLFINSIDNNSRITDEAKKKKEVGELLTGKQEKFILNVISGMSQRQAYRDAYPSSLKWKDKNVDGQASALMAKPEVLTRYRELIERQENKALLSRWEKRKLLADIARSVDVSESDRIRAIDTDNKMEQVYRTKLDDEEQRIRIERAKIAKKIEEKAADPNNDNGIRVVIVNDTKKNQD